MDMKTKAAAYTAATMVIGLGFMSLVVINPESAFYVACTLLVIMMTYLIYSGFLMRERRKQIDREYEEAKKKRDEHWEKLMGRSGSGGQA